MACLGTTLAATAERRAAAPAVWFDGIWHTYGELDRAAAGAAAQLLEAGVASGDRVAVGLPNSVELIVAVLAALRAGAVLVPLNPAYTEDELAYVLGDATPRVALLHAQHRAMAGRLDTPPKLLTLSPNGGAMLAPVDQSEASAALMIYTSGTTGRPKGAVLSHRALLSNLPTVAAAWGWTESDRLLLTLPCFHLHGLGLGILTSLLVGSSVVLKPRFVADDVLADLSRHACTMFFGVPTIYNRLAALPAEQFAAHDLSRMRLWVSGSAPLNPATWEAFEQRSGFALMDRYGMTECCFALSTALGERRRPGVVGRALPGVEVRIVDADAADAGAVRDVDEGKQGEILIKGPNLFSGYWQRPQETAQAMLHGYLRSGDLALRQPDGQIAIVGRSSVDIIKTRGFKVGALEIESVLQRHPAVQEVAVVGLPDADQGERIVAAVTPTAPDAVDAAELLELARAHLAPHKLPSAIVFIAEIPRTGPGKFKKKELIRILSADERR